MCKMVLVHFHVIRARFWMSLELYSLRKRLKERVVSILVILKTLIIEFTCAYVLEIFLRLVLNNFHLKRYLVDANLKYIMD